MIYCNSLLFHLLVHKNYYNINYFLLFFGFKQIMKICTKLKKLHKPIRWLNENKQLQSKLYCYISKIDNKRKSFTIKKIVNGQINTIWVLTLIKNTNN